MQEVVLSVVDNLKGYFYVIKEENYKMTMIHCRNSDCKYYWEDSCTISLESRKLIALDENGKCEEQEDGISNWYKDG